MASLYRKIQNVLATDEACTITEHGDPVYAVVRWDVYQELVHVRDEYRVLRAAQADAQDEEADIDINRIPV
ncbi:MAG: hypothetical protein WC246_03350 [Candidatus Paceibacterota bacterium]|jgi:hypothetical protein